MDRSLDDDGLRADRESMEVERVPQQSRYSRPSEESRSAYELRGRDYHLNSPQSAVLRDVGAWRSPNGLRAQFGRNKRRRAGHVRSRGSDEIRHKPRAP